MGDYYATTISGPPALRAWCAARSGLDRYLLLGPPDEAMAEPDPMRAAPAMAPTAVATARARAILRLLIPFLLLPMGGVAWTLHTTTAGPKNARRSGRQGLRRGRL